MTKTTKEEKIRIILRYVNGQESLNQLQEELKRADIQPVWWVINQSLYTTRTKDPILMGRVASETKWINKVSEELSKSFCHHSLN